MSKILKSKLGMFLSAIYLLILVSVLIEANTPAEHAMTGLGLLIVTAPCSFAFSAIFLFLGIPEQSYMIFLYVSVVLGGLINIIILFLAGYLLSETFNTSSSNKK